MPGPALHHMIARELRGRIEQGKGLGATADYAALQALLADDKNLPYFYLGCQGPDFLFFNSKDWPAGTGELVEIFLDVYDAINGIKDSLRSLVPDPVLAVLDGVGMVKDEVIKNSSTLSELEAMLHDMGSVIDGLAANLIEWVKKYISDYNLYDAIGHPYRDGQAKGAWWWFDTLHYRKTGRYAKALLDNTEPDSALRLYALGYLTHFTADTVGHPFVNINCGGPYRNQAQRHKTGENLQDVFNMHEHLAKDWNRAKHHAKYNFNYTGVVSPPDAEEDDEVPDKKTNLPDALAELIAATINGMYESGSPDDNEYGHHISPSEVNDAYRLWYRWLRSATDTGTLPEPVPYSLSAELEEVWDKAKERMGDIGDFIEDSMSSAGSMGFLGIFLVLAALILAAVAAAAALIDALLGSLTTLTVAAIRATLCLVYEELYNSFQNFRLGVSLNGLAFPMLEHLDEPRFTQFKNTAFPDSTGVTASMLKNELPRLKFGLPANTPGDAAFNREAHLAYPASSGEPNHAIGAPDSYFDKTSLFYAFGDIPLNKKFIDDLADLASAQGDDAVMDLIHKHSAGKPPATLGNAMALTEEIFSRWQSGGKVPDFNLDADRGYAYTCWTQQTGGVDNSREAPQQLAQNPVDLSFIKNA